MKKLLLIFVLFYQTAVKAQPTDSAYLWVNGLSVNYLYNSDNYYEQYQNPWPYTNLTRVPLFHQKSIWKSFTSMGELFVGVRGDGTLWTWFTNKNEARAPELNPINNIKQTYEQVVFGLGRIWIYGITTNGHLYAVNTNGQEVPLDTVNTFRKIARGNGKFSVLRSDKSIWYYTVSHSGIFGGPIQIGSNFKWVDIAINNHCQPTKIENCYL